jgi:predicted RNase H-like nuclease
MNAFKNTFVLRRYLLARETAVGIQAQVMLDKLVPRYAAQFSCSASAATHFPEPPLKRKTFLEHLAAAIYSSNVCVSESPEASFDDTVQ